MTSIFYCVGFVGLFFTLFILHQQNKYVLFFNVTQNDENKIFPRDISMGDHKRTCIHIPTKLLKSQYSQSDNHSSFKTIQFLA